MNLLLDTTLEIKRGSPCSKKRYIAELIIIKETFDLCDNWRIRNPAAKQFTFRQKHVSDFTQGRGRLDFFFISNSLQIVINHADTFGALSVDHFPLTILISKDKNCIHGHSF